ncbi:MAG: organomercurial lyase [Gammaproteobacteria bacterium]|nr:organomercurial lyase [Gammaproteobacteria bacterium]
MSAPDKITTAIQRLAAILPLRQNLESLDAEARKIHDAIQRCYITEGRAPTLAEINAVIPQARDALHTLAGKDIIVTNAEGEIIGAYPFSSEPRTSRIEINGHSVHAMCALDALAPSAMAHCKSRVVSRCAVTQAEVMVELDDRKILNADETRDLFVGINWQAARSAGSCATSLCTEMLFLKGEAVASQWQAESPASREIFTLPEAIQFSAGFFAT